MIGSYHRFSDQLIEIRHHFFLVCVWYFDLLELRKTHFIKKEIVML